MSAPKPSGPDDELRYDATFLHSRTEAIIIFCVWLACLLWAAPFCYLTGYAETIDPATFPTVWGIPSWLFWGVLVPWIVADLFTVWFCFCYMADDDLGPGGEMDGSDGLENAAAGGEEVDRWPGS